VKRNDITALARVTGFQGSGNCESGKNGSVSADSEIYPCIVATMAVSNGQLHPFPHQPMSLLRMCSYVYRVSPQNDIILYSC
jgi:hypothetical protein